MRISGSLSNFKNYCTSSDFCSCPNTGKFSSNLQSRNKTIKLLTPNPHKKHIDRSSSIVVAKYQKLYRHSQRIFSRKRTIDVEDRFCDRVEFLIFETASAFCNNRASELHNTVTSLPHSHIKLVFRAFRCRLSPIHSTPSLLFFAIVAVVEVEVGR